LTVVRIYKRGYSDLLTHGSTLVELDQLRDSCKHINASAPFYKTVFGLESANPATVSRRSMLAQENVVSGLAGPCAVVDNLARWSRSLVRFCPRRRWSPV